MGVKECELIFDGVSSKDVGITVEGYPGALLPEKSVDTEEIPGRNGYLLYDYGTYRNYDQPYTIHWRNIDSDARIAQWLYKQGYRRLEDSFHPEHYRMAYFDGVFEIDNRMDVIKRAEIEFRCKPQWFRKNGDYKINATNGQTLVNTGMDALPIITVNGSGRCSVSVGNTSITISNVPSNGIVIDCELQDAYSPDKDQNLNSLISLSGEKFPVLSRGANTVSFTGSVESVIIVPRYWDLL